MGVEFVLQDEVLEICGLPMHTWLTLLYVHLKIVKVVNFTQCSF